MLVNLIAPSISYNIKLATVVGVENAVYITALSDLYYKEVKNQNVEADGYFKINRDYITSITGINAKDQQVLDKKLESLEILKYNNPCDKLILNIQTIIDIISEDDKVEINKIKKATRGRPPSNTETKKQAVINALKQGLNVTNSELLEAYKGWIDGVYSNPKGFLSKRSIEIFQNQLNEYTKGDLDLALAILEIATVNGHRDVTWAINMYEERKPKRGRKPQNLTETPVLNKTEVF